MPITKVRIGTLPASTPLSQALPPPKPQADAKRFASNTTRNERSNMPDQPATEKHLIDLARKGDRSALGQLLDHHHNRLYNVALRMVSNRDDAAEITQDAMLKVVQHIASYDGRSKLSTWMIRITMNQSISFLRKRKLRKTTSLDMEFSSGGTGGDGDGPNLGDRIAGSEELQPDQRVQKTEMIEQLHKALDCVDDDFRAILVLRDINEMDYQQISDVLSVPVGTVKSRLFRARLALREEMNKVFPIET